MQFSPTRGCFAQMFKKQILKHSSKQLFWHQFCLWKTPSSRFFAFFPPCMPFFFKKNYLPILGELRKLHAKIYTFSVKIGREINFQSWLLYDCFFHSCYNFAIVQCCENIQWKSLQRLSLTRRTIGLVISCGAIGGLQSYSVYNHFMHWECSGEHKA